MPRRFHQFKRKLKILCLLYIAPCAHGSLWESDEWALTGTLNGSAGYDSNLTVSRDGPEDFFIIANPFLTFVRRNSSTDLRFNGGVTRTEFINRRQPAQTDLTFTAVYAYPNAENVIPVYRIEGGWQKKSQPNPYLGERVQNKETSLKAEGFFPLTGKLGVRGTAGFDKSSYDANELNRSSRFETFAGLAYKRSPRTELSLNLGAAFGRSKPNDPTRFVSDVRSKELYVTTRLRGEITGKISGSAYAGFGRVSYSGGYTNRNNLPVAGADLTWGFDPRRTFVLAAYSGAEYAPDGQAVTVTRTFISFTHVIIGRWQYVLRAGPTHAVFSREVRQRTDNVWDLGTEFAYRPSDRFRVSLSLNHTTQNSDSSVSAFSRDVVSLGSSYRF